MQLNLERNINKEGCHCYQVIIVIVVIIELAHLSRGFPEDH